ncbi:hypothetical protein ACWDSJ_06695 [Nocardia sp. NPDC003482]
MTDAEIAYLEKLGDEEVAKAKADGIFDPDDLAWIREVSIKHEQTLLSQARGDWKALQRALANPWRSAGSRS